MFSTQPTYSIIPCLPSLFILVNFILCGSKRGYSIVLLEANVSAIFDLRLAKAVYFSFMILHFSFVSQFFSSTKGAKKKKKIRKEKKWNRTNKTWKLLDNALWTTQFLILSKYHVHSWYYSLGCTSIWHQKHLFELGTFFLISIRFSIFFLFFDRKYVRVVISI